MARVTAPTTLIEMALRGSLGRDAVDERTRWFGRRVVELLEVELEVTGAARVPTDRAVVYLSNHQSHMDVPMLYASLPSSTIRMLAKAELFDIPIWGRALGAAEFIEVHRGEHARGVEAIERREAADGRGRQHLDRARGHALARRLDRQAQEGRLSPRARDGRADRAGRDQRHPGDPAAAAASDAMVKGRHVEVAIGAPIDVAGRDVAGLVDEVRSYFVDHVH